MSSNSKAFLMKFLPDSALLGPPAETSEVVAARRQELAKPTQQQEDDEAVMEIAPCAALEDLLCEAPVAASEKKQVEVDHRESSPLHRDAESVRAASSDLSANREASAALASKKSPSTIAPISPAPPQKPTERTITVLPKPSSSTSPASKASKASVSASKEDSPAAVVQDSDNDDKPTISSYGEEEEEEEDDMWEAVDVTKLRAGKKKDVGAKARIVATKSRRSPFKSPSARGAAKGDEDSAEANRKPPPKKARIIAADVAASSNAELRTMLIRIASPASNEADEDDGEDSFRPFFPTGSSGAAPNQTEEPLIIGRSVLHKYARRYLRPYQIAGVEWMYMQLVIGQGGILNDDMGLGKTVQVMCLLMMIFEKTGQRKVDLPRVRQRRVGRGRFLGGTLLADEFDDGRPSTVIITCPSAVLTNWQRELELWGWFDVEVLNEQKNENRRAVIASCNLEGKSKGWGGRNRPEVLLVSHSLLVRHAADFADVSFGVCVIDEIHVFKNTKTASYKAANAIAATVKIGLTGTLMQNNLKELWTIMSLVNPNLLGAAGDFVAHYGVPINRARNKLATDDMVCEGNERARELTAKLAPVVLRRTKDSVLAEEMPSKQEHVVFCPLQPLQVATYRRILEGEDAQLILRRKEPCDCGREAARGKCCHRSGNGPLWNALHPTGEECKQCPMCLLLPLCTKLNQCATHLDLLKAQYDTNDRERVVSFATMAFGNDLTEIGGVEVTENVMDKSDEKLCGKLKVLGQLVDVWKRMITKQNKILVFSHYIRVLRVVASFMIRRHPDVEFVRFDGTSSALHRDEAIDKFTKKPEVRMMLVSTKAGGVGLNLTAANIVVLFDQSWNPMYEAQAQDRAFRLGQRRDVDVFRLVSTGTLEEKMYCRQLYKIHLGNVSTLNTNEPRMFEGVQGDASRTGDLFGAANLFAFEPERGFMSVLKEQFKWKSDFKARKADLGDNASSARGIQIEDIGEIRLSHDMEKELLPSGSQGGKKSAAAAPKKKKGAAASSKKQRGGSIIDEDDEEDDLFAQLLFAQDEEDKQSRSQALEDDADDLESISSSDPAEEHRGLTHPNKVNSESEEEEDEQRKQTADIIATTTMNVNAKQLVVGRR